MDGEPVLQADEILDSLAEGKAHGGKSLPSLCKKRRD